MLLVREREGVGDEVWDFKGEVDSVMEIVGVLVAEAVGEMEIEGVCVPEGVRVGVGVLLEV